MTFFNPSNIERATSFSSRLMMHAQCLNAGENIVYLWREWLSFRTATSRESVHSDYIGNFVTNQKTALFVSANHRAQKVPGEREGEN